MIHSKKKVAAFLLATYIFPLICFLTVQFTLTVNRFVIKESLEKSILQKVVIAPTQIHWVEEGHELVLNGEMFDVHSIHSLNNGLIEIWGLSDKKEDQLNQQVDYLLNHQKGVQSIVTKLIQLQSICAALSIPSFQFHVNLPQQINYFTLIAIESSFIEVIKPPPQRLLIC